VQLQNIMRLYKNKLHKETSAKTGGGQFANHRMKVLPPQESVITISQNLDNSHILEITHGNVSPPPEDLSPKMLTLHQDSEQNLIKADSLTLVPIPHPMTQEGDSK